MTESKRIRLCVIVLFTSIFSLIFLCMFFIYAQMVFQRELDRSLQQHRLELDSLKTSHSVLLRKLHNNRTTSFILKSDNPFNTNEITPATNAQLDQQLKEVDWQLNGNGSEFEHARQTLYELALEYGDLARIQWRMSKYFYEKAFCFDFENDDSDEILQTFKTGMEYGKRAIDLDPMDIHTYEYYMWNAFEMLDLTQSVQVQMHYGVETIYKARNMTELDPNYWATIHINGCLIYGYAITSWVGQSTLLVLVPDFDAENGTLENALEHFLKAKDNVTEHHRTYVWKSIAVAYFDMANYKKGFEWLDKAMALPIKTCFEKKLYRDMIRLNKKYENYR